MNELWDDLPQDLRDNPFFHFSEDDFIPAWDRIKPEHILPAFEYLLDYANKAIEKIVNDEGPATFENTVVALDDAFALPSYFARVAWNMMPGKDAEAEHDEAVDEMTVWFGFFFNDVFRHNRALFERLCTVWPALRPEGDQPWLVPPGIDENFDIAINDLVSARGTEIPADLRLKNDMYMMYQNGFIEAGIGFSAAKRWRLDVMDDRINRLSMKAQRNMKRANQEYYVFVEDEAELSGLSKQIRENARKLADEVGAPGKWAFGLGRETSFSVLQTADDRGLRRMMWKTVNAQATSGRTDNRKIVLELAKLQQKRQRLLGYPNLAKDILQYNMAGDAKTVKKFLDRMSAAVMPAARREMDELAEFARARDGIQLEPWDVKYYAEILKKERFGFDEEEIAEYFPLEHVLKEILAHFEAQLNIRFEESPGTPVYHPDVRAFKIRDGDSDRLLGTIFLDILAREDKPAGIAWDANIWPQGKYKGEDRRPIDAVVCKFLRGDPTLLTHDSVLTLLHEVGHGTNNIVSESEFSSFSGYNVRSDFVEFCSQIQENFGWEPEFIQKLGRHYKTGAPLPPEKIENLAKSRKFMAATDILELRLKKSVLDYHWHTANLDKVTNVRDFEKAATAQHRILNSDSVTELPHMAHISGGGYEMNFYAYAWSAYDEADAYGRFQEEGLYNPAVTRDYRRIPQQGGTVEPDVLFREFRGRDPDEKYFLKRYGLRAPFVEAIKPKTPPGGEALTRKYTKIIADYGHDRDATFAYLTGQDRTLPPFVQPKEQAIPKMSGPDAAQLGLFAPSAPSPAAS